ncbi:MAG: hypothetical protein PHF60_05660 [Candidatus ainarchaeum sp.]|nr:hypothetical protein [Candidatus ainarchaeum sp.]
MKPVLLLAFLILSYGCIQVQTSPTAPNETQTTQPPSSCSDSDGGDNPNTKGSVVVGTGVYEDSCESGASVREYYCEGATMKSDVEACAPGYTCSSGACILKPPSNVTHAIHLCTETDEGDDIWTAGTLIYEGANYSDACQGVYNILEYYCENDSMRQKSVGCGTGSKCQDGACVAPERTCSDSDLSDTLIIGTTTEYAGGIVVTTKMDYCLDNDTRNEYYCEGGRLANRSMDCPQDTYCASGACVSVCDDKDDGADYETASSVKDSTGTHSDYCVDYTVLMEYVCSGTGAVAQEYTCSGACADGRCYDSSELKCKEYSSGKEARLTADSVIVRSEFDSCSDYQTVLDYSCVSNSIEFTDTSCDDDEICSDGECTAITGEGCHDLDVDAPEGPIHVASLVALTTNDSIKSVKYDSCINDITVSEFYCDGELAKIDYLTCPEEEKCVDAACIYPYTCIDSDGGQNLEPGQVSLMEGETAVRTERDACSDDTHVHEVYCTSDDRIGYALLACPSGTTCDSTDGSCK